MNRSKVLCVGRLYCDLVFAGMPRFPSLGTEVFAEGLSAHAGGGAFITAAHLASLGHEVSLATMLPAMPFAALVEEQIAQAGLDTSLSETLPKSSDPQLTVALVQEGDRAFVSRRSGPPFPSLTADQIAENGHTHLHIGELASALERPDIIATARAAGMTISMDCGWDDGFVASNSQPLIRAVDVFLPNEAEASHLRKVGVDPSLAGITVVKQGEKGATAMSKRGATIASTRPQLAVDTTGAGDAFNAGFVSAWLQNAPLEVCLASGNELGGRVVRQLGGFQAAPRPEAGHLMGL